MEGLRSPKGRSWPTVLRSPEDDQWPTVLRSPEADQWPTVLRSPEADQLSSGHQKLTNCPPVTRSWPLAWAGALSPCRWAPAWGSGMRPGRFCPGRLFLCRRPAAAPRGEDSWWYWPEPWGGRARWWLASVWRGSRRGPTRGACNRGGGSRHIVHNGVLVMDNRAGWNRLLLHIEIGS